VDGSLFDLDLRVIVNYIDNNKDNNNRIIMIEIFIVF
jgi:hypothetical protein